MDGRHVPAIQRLGRVEARQAVLQRGDVDVRVAVHLGEPVAVLRVVLGEVVVQREHAEAVELQPQVPEHVQDAEGQPRRSRGVAPRPDEDDLRVRTHHVA